MGEPDRQKAMKELKALMIRAHEGDRGALPKLREVMDVAPSLARDLVDPAKIAEQSAMGFYGKEDDLLAREALPRVLEQMRSELEGDDPSPLERMLVGRVVATWLQVNAFEALYARSARKLTLSQGEHHQRRIDRAHNRHLSAVRALTQARRTGPTIPVQINVARQQVNNVG